MFVGPLILDAILFLMTLARVGWKVTKKDNPPLWVQLYRE